jgi:hypothetical protein
MKNKRELKTIKGIYLILLLTLGFIGIGVCLFVLMETPILAQNANAVRLENATFLIKAVGEQDVKNDQTRKEKKGKGRLIFKAGEKIFIQTLIKNKSQEPLRLTNFDWMYQYRFDLWKIGEPKVRSVRKDLTRLFYQRENDIGAGSFRSLPPVLPGKSQELLTIDLDEVYDKLEPGRYKLIVYYRGAFRAKKLASNPLTIEIIP